MVNLATSNTQKDYATAPKADTSNSDGYLACINSCPAADNITCQTNCAKAWGYNTPQASSTPPPTGSPGGGECTLPPTTAQRQETQNALDYMIPLLNAIPPMSQIVSPPPVDYQNAVQGVVDQNNNITGNANAVYPPYVNDNVIALNFAYIVGPANHVVSNIVGMGTTWRAAWRVTSTSCGGGGNNNLPI